MVTNMLPRGVWPVMLTPFGEDGSIDWPALDALTDWYLAAGVAGLFAVSGSSEVYQLADDEKVALAARVVARVNGRIPVVASAIDFGPPARQADLVRRIADTGVTAAVLATCQLAGEREDDSTWLARAEKLLSLTGAVPLGLYEIPTPYKRLLTADQVRWAAKTGRFVFFKETSCTRDAVCAKIDAVRGTPLRLYNAHTPTLLDSLLAGGDGFCGIGANYDSALYVELCAGFRDRPERAARIQEFLTRADPLMEAKYPLGAKMCLAGIGLPIRPVCRLPVVPLTPDDVAKFRQFMAEVERLRAT